MLLGESCKKQNNERNLKLLQNCHKSQEISQTITKSQ